jgi:hypothetical protein
MTCKEDKEWASFSCQGQRRPPGWWWSRLRLEAWVRDIQKSRDRVLPAVPMAGAKALRVVAGREIRLEKR